MIYFSQKRSQPDVDRAGFERTIWFKARVPFTRKPCTFADFVGRKSHSLRNVEKAYSGEIARAEAAMISAVRSRS